MTHLKNDNFEHLNTPNYMWIVFMNDIGVQAAFEQETFKFQESEFKVKRAQHPTDIIFSNREITTDQHKCRRLSSILFIVSFGIIFFFLGLYLLKWMEIIGFMQKPPLKDCNHIKDNYDSSELQSLAFQEFLAVKKNI